MKSVPIEYKFSSLNDMYEFLTVENVDDFLIDFSGMLKDAVELRNRLTTLTGLPIGAFDLKINTFSWIDDGEHDDSKGSLNINGITV